MKFSNIELFAGGENARIQSFPDEWRFCGSMAKLFSSILKTFEGMLRHI